jgi:excisionase family DNA binding protein
VPEGWLRKKVSAGEIPFTRPGRHVRFTDEHLEAIVANGEQGVSNVPKPSGVSRRARRASLNPVTPISAK